MLWQVTACECDHDCIITTEQYVDQDNLPDHQPVQVLKKFKHSVSCSG
jgi:hypothetical protein